MQAASAAQQQTTVTAAGQQFQIPAQVMQAGGQSAAFTLVFVPGQATAYRMGIPSDYPANYKAINQ